MNQANTYVYRYLKTGDIKGAISWADIDSNVEVSQGKALDFISEKTFQLDPGEKDISFFRSSESDNTLRILDVLSALRKRRGGGFSVNSGMMRIDFQRAHEDLNDIRETVRFVDNDKTGSTCRHYGLIIIGTTSAERLDAVTGLLELSSFYALKQKAKNPDTRDILELVEGGKFFAIAKDVPV